ncbi:serine hydrolase domain-containing protein [uncultured Aquimarina sp.]|uniref:serine hydrolase domain-containing protein n=1 Tax=uncultured Aquimarina sp. TaxID=575652 RepID=UPI002617BBA7|nr:serine hydrolase domain-containing protein [uncultured Aquimarina sp.]
MKLTSFLNYLLITLIILASGHQSTNAQTLEAKIDSLLYTKYETMAPGAVFLVAKNGNIIYRKAFGKSNLELNTRMQPENVFEIGSMTKQFTAIAILMLMEKGKLSLDDDITKYIPDYPTNGKTITIHHLLNHTSGIKSFTRIKALKDIARKDLTPIELIDFFKNEPMDFNPGEQYKYNNSGYIILGYIIESISKQSYASFIEEHIFKKLGMNASLFASHNKVVKNRAYGYHKKEEYINAKYISFTLPYAAGSLLSNVDDMLTWQEALNHNLLVSKNTVDKAFTNYTLNNGNPINYGYGWHIKEINGTLSREHGGSIFGFKSMGVYLPLEDIYVIGLNNCDCNSPTKITREIAGLAVDTFK